VVLLRGARGLAIGPFARLRWRDEARRRRPRGTTLLDRGPVPSGPVPATLSVELLRPVLLGMVLAGGMPSPVPSPPGGCRSSGGSGVIWSA